MRFQRSSVSHFYYLITSQWLTVPSDGLQSYSCQHTIHFVVHQQPPDLLKQWNIYMITYALEFAVSMWDYDPKIFCKFYGLFVCGFPIRWSQFSVTFKWILFFHASHNFKPRLQQRILVPCRGYFQNFATVGVFAGSCQHYTSFTQMLKHINFYQLLNA